MLLHYQADDSMKYNTGWCTENTEHWTSQVWSYDLFIKLKWVKLISQILYSCTIFHSNNNNNNNVFKRQ